MNIFENKAFLIGLSHFQNQTPLFITIKLKKCIIFLKLKQLSMAFWTTPNSSDVIFYL